MDKPDIQTFEPKTPIDPIEENVIPKREEKRRRGRRSLVAAGRLDRKARGVKSSLLG